MKRLALIGGRGYTGAELLGLLVDHPGIELAFASSGSQAGMPIKEACATWPNEADEFISLTPDEAGRETADCWVLAVPNGAAKVWATAIEAAHPDAVVLDLSADHRFDAGWVYGLPERFRTQLSRAKRISNPGCYATGTQLALLPLLGDLDGAPVVFGVSGYSGAGKTPSPNNDPERLRDNLIPYTLTGHVHETEVSHQLERSVRFMPHVAPFFRGINLTIAVQLHTPGNHEQLLERYERFYSDEPRVKILDGIPNVQAVQGTPDCIIGGFVVDPRDPRRITLVAVLDNLLKGAASQALQNINLALGLSEHAGVSQ